jgi:hypothetical protein
VDGDLGQQLLGETVGVSTAACGWRGFAGSLGLEGNWGDRRAFSSLGPFLTAVATFFGPFGQLAFWALVKMSKPWASLGLSLGPGGERGTQRPGPRMVAPRTLTSHAYCPWLPCLSSLRWHQLSYSMSPSPWVNYLRDQIPVMWWMVTLPWTGHYWKVGKGRKTE